MKEYKYTKLSNEAQIRAIADYANGFLETHAKRELPSNNDIHYILKFNLTDDRYTINGERIENE